MFGLIPNSGINNFAHLGGFLTGLLLGWVFSVPFTTWKAQLQKRLERGLMYLCILIVALSYTAVIYNLYLLIRQ
jgi:rhomboid protease GluP